MAPQSFFASPIIERGLPNAVTYDLSQSNQVTISLPAGSTWSSGLHWHEDHVEYLRVVKGRVRVRLGDAVRTVDAASADEPVEIRVDRNVWHEWSRAGPDGDEVVVVERTDPEDGQKAVFFWNLNGVILRAQQAAAPPYLFGWLHGALLDFWVTLSLFVIFRSLDNVPVFWNVAEVLSRWGVDVRGGSTVGAVSRGADRVVSHFILLLAAAAGWACGVKPVREEFTPKAAYHAWLSAHGAGRFLRKDD